MKVLSIFLPALLIFATAMAQQDTCSTTVNAALSSIDTLCERTGRNELCYGHENVQVTTFAGSLDFNSPGDVTSINNVHTIRTSPLILPDEWGIALMRVQANIPDTLPGQDVVFLLFGEVEIENATSPAAALNASTTTSMNVRGGPSTNAPVRAALEANTPLGLIGRNEAGDWAAFTTEEITGWLYVPLLSIEGDVSTLEIIGADDLSRPHYGAMQAVYFTSGIGEASCREAPRDGIMIRTPDVDFPIELRINEVTLQIGSTIYLQAQPESNMNIYVVDGETAVVSQDVRRIVPEGAFTTVPLDAEGRAAGPPSEPEPYSLESVAPLPVNTVGDEVSIAQPASQETIETANQTPTIEGIWTAIDTDGSRITATILALGNNLYRVDYYDDATTGAGCNGGAISGGGEGTLINNTLALQLAGICLNSSNTWGPSGVIYTYDPETDALIETWAGWVPVYHTRQH